LIETLAYESYIAAREVPSGFTVASFGICDERLVKPNSKDAASAD
jgi:hypothetical protein